jgi:O-antigen/teichoic acid export membrane protein
VKKMPTAESNPPDTENAVWKAVGFHRPLAGILYNLIFIFIAAGFGVILTVWLIPNFILPFPEALGFTTITTQIFGFYFTLLDLGIGASIQRFVAAENVKNPRKAIQYIQFFCWYQMFSGLGQVTFIAWWVFTMVPKAELAYASWFFLIYSTIQYPGMLGIFRSTLESYQRYHKARSLRTSSGTFSSSSVGGSARKTRQLAR